MCVKGDAAMPNAQKQRLEYFDIAKGIGMLAIIAGHMGIKAVNGFVFTFHVPLFFIISGYFYRDREGFLKSKAKQLLLPYAVTALAVTLILTLEELLKYILGKVELFSAWNTLLEYLVLSIYGNGSGGNLTPIYRGAYIGAIWFLLALFWGFIFLRFLLRIKNMLVQFLIAVTALIIGAVSAKFIWLPFSVQAGMTAVLFMWAGKMIADHGGMQKVLENKLCMIGCAAVWLVAIFFSYRNGNMSLVRAYFPNMILNGGGGVQLAAL